jgi:hypothetical protein
VIPREARWAILFLVGVATVTATAFGWRSAQIGSTAAFDDRQSIGETVAVEQGVLQRSGTVALETREYERYRADYAVAAAFDRRGNSRQANALRLGATRRAAAAGVFGSPTIGDELLHPHAAARPFDVAARTRALASEGSTELDSAAALDPDHWAESATAIRARTRGLTRWGLIVLIAVPLLTIAETSRRRRAVYGFAAVGVAVYLTGLIGGLTQVFW